MNDKQFYADYVRSGKLKTDYWRDHCPTMTRGQFYGLMWRIENKLNANRPLFTHDFGIPWVFEPGHYIIVGDIHVPTTHYDFAALPMAIAQRYIPPGKRNLIIAGDFFNMDAFSTHESDVHLPSMGDELLAARQFLLEYREIFDRVYWIMGNHERRLGKRTRAAISPDNLRAMITSDRNVFVSNFGYCTVRAPNMRSFDWRITHGRNYSVNQLTVGDQLALRHQCNIISHHQHHLAKGFDRYKRYIVVDNGGLFDQNKLAYVMMDDSKMPNMTNGFSWLKPNGTVEVFGEAPFTDWEAWLDVPPLKQKKTLKLA